MRILWLRMWKLSLRSPITMSLLTGSVAAITVLGAGLALIKFHGGIWPWWFHGFAVALITSLITTLFMYFHLRELSRREARRLAGERLSHEVCTALQILFQCTYLQPDQRSQFESEAVRRLHIAAREILPDLMEMTDENRSALFVSLDEGGEERKAERAASGMK